MTELIKSEINRPTPNRLLNGTHSNADVDVIYETVDSLVTCHGDGMALYREQDGLLPSQIGAISARAA